MSITDSELLELAAKAVGWVHLGNGETCDPKVGNIHWNPLTDDGDALRLANKLWLQIRHVHGKAHAGMPDRFWCTELWFPDGDQDAATRRAIVRAAAEIGRAMP